MTNEEELPQAIVARALAEERGSDARWAVVTELHLRHDEAALRLLFGLLESPEEEVRELAADALGQFGTERGAPVEAPRVFSKEIVERLLEVSPRERAPEVIGSIAVAFGHLRDERVIPTLAEWAKHPDDDVREDVVFALAGFETDLAVTTFITLMEDSSSTVRDWATFGLGVQTDRDSPEIRAALLARLDDEDQQTRGEALVGLAQRGDDRVLPWLLAEVDAMDDDDPWLTLDDAVYALAAATQPPALRDVVARSREHWLQERSGQEMWGNLQEAIEAYGL